MKVTVTPRTIYEVRIDGNDVGEFECESEWESMKCLVHRTKARKLVVFDERTTGFIHLFGEPTGVERPVDVITYDPSLIPTGVEETGGITPIALSPDGAAQ